MKRAQWMTLVVGAIAAVVVFWVLRRNKAVRKVAGVVGGGYSVPEGERGRTAKATGGYSVPEGERGHTATGSWDFTAPDPYEYRSVVAGLGSISLIGADPVG